MEEHHEKRDQPVALAPDARAMEEMRILQGVIKRAEQQEFQVRGWLLVMLSALLAALYSEKSKLNGIMFGGVSGQLTLFFANAELITRIVKRKAIRRVARVEAALRGDGQYDGPMIAKSLSGEWGMKTLLRLMWHEALIITVWGFYLPIWLIVLALATLNR